MKDIVLRDYQQEALDALWASLQSGYNALLQGPCAFGKSITLASVINKFLEHIPDGRVLIIVDREVLVRQLAETVKDVTGLTPGIVCASVQKEKQLEEQITIATRQTLINHLNKCPAVQLLIADEAHLIPLRKDGKPTADQYGRIIDRMYEYNSKMRMLGVTATPYSLTAGYIYGQKNREDLIPYFTRVSHSVQYETLIKKGYLCKIVGRIHDSKMDLSDISLVAGEYNLGQLSEKCQMHVHTINEAIEKYAKGHDNIIIFCVDIAHVEAVVEAVPDSVAYHSKQTPLEHIAAMQGYQNGRFRCIVSVSQLSIGFDHPPTSCAIMARPTKSVSLFIQCIGRIMRPHDGKEECLLVDLTTNSKDHLARFDIDRPIVNVPMIPGDGEAPFKLCPGEDDEGFVCMEQVHPRVMICPECGYRWEKDIARHLEELKKIEFDSKPPPPPDPPEWLKVLGMKIVKHESKKNGKFLIRVTMDLDVLTRFGSASEWICCADQYKGYAVEKGREKWANFTDEEMPDDTDTAIWIAEDSFEMPEKVLCTKNEKGFYNVVKHKKKVKEEIFLKEEDFIPDGSPFEGGDVPF